MKARSEQDQRPKRRRDQRRDDLGDSGQVRVVVVLGGDEYPEHDLRDRGQTAHSLIFVAHAGGPSPQRCEVCRAVVRMAGTGRGGTGSYRPLMVVIREGTMRAAKGGRQGEP